MAKNGKDFGSDDPNAEATSYNTVFVDTSLDTHLVLTISSSDTVYDFKEKMLRLHSQIFSKIDGVKIHSVKVKRRGQFYHLPDAMLVSTAFGRTKKAWFVFVEASSCSGEHGKELVLHGATLGKDFRVSPLSSACSGDDDCSRYNKETTDISRLGELPSMLKKRKIECIENVGLTMNEKNKTEKKIDPSVDACGKVQSEIETRKIVGANSTEVGIKITDPLSSTVADLALTGLKNDKIVNDQSMLSLDESQKNDTSEKEMVLSLNHDSQVQPSESVKPSDEIEAQEMSEGGADGTNKSVPFMGTSSPTEAVGSVGTKKKAPGSTEVGTKITAPLSSTVADLALNDQSMLSLDESQKNKNDTRDDPQVQPSESVKPSAPPSSTVADLSLKDLENDKIVNDQSMPSVDESQKNKNDTRDDPQVQPSESVKPSAPPSSTVADLDLKDLKNDKIVNDQSMPSVDESQKNDKSKKKIVLALPCNSSGTIKREKLKAKKSAAKLQDKSDIDVKMNDVNAERNQAQINKLKDNSALSSKHKPEGNKILDSAIEILNEKASGFAEMSLDPGIEARKSGRSLKKKRAKLHAASDDNSSPMEHSIPGGSQKKKRTKKHTNSVCM